MKKPALSQFILIAAMSLMASTSNMMLSPVISVYARDHIHASVAEIGIIIASFFIVSLLSKPIVGLYCQGIKTLYALWIGLALMSFPSIGMALTNSSLAFGILRTIQGFGNSLFWAPAMTLVALTSTESRRNINISNYSFSVSVGMSIGPALGSISIAALGIRNTFLLVFAIIFAAFLLGIILFRRRALFSRELGQKDEESFSLKELSKIFSTDAFKNVFATYVTLSFIYGILVAYGTLFFKDNFNVSDEEVAFLFLGYNLAIMFSRFSLTRLVHAINKDKILLFSLANWIVLLIAIQITSNFLLFVVAFSLLGISHGFVYPTGILTIAETTEREKLALSNSIYLAGWDIGNTLGPLVAAPIVTIYGTKAAISVALLSPILTLLSVLFLGKKRKRQS